MFLLRLDTFLVAIAGIWTSTLTWPAGETWIHHVLVQYPGAFAFLVVDTAIFIAAVALTTTQASMVIALNHYHVLVVSMLLS